MVGKEMKLKFYQVYYEDDQLKECYDFGTRHRSLACSDFFENSIIEDLVPKTEADYISVCSWRLRQKRQDGWVPVLCKFPGYDDLSEEKILREDFDVAVLTPRGGTHQMLKMAADWHGGPKHNYAWDEAMKEFKKYIKVPEEVKTPIYENHFIARSELYHEYVSDCLSGAIQFMRERDVFFSDSGYCQKKEQDKKGGGLQAVERYRLQTGRKDWPIAPFILERLFSIWINDKKLKIVYV